MVALCGFLCNMASFTFNKNKKIIIKATTVIKATVVKRELRFIAVVVSFIIIMFNLLDVRQY